MRVQVYGQGLWVQAVAGTHVVLSVEETEVRQVVAAARRLSVFSRYLCEDDFPRRFYVKDAPRTRGRELFRAPAR